MKIVLLFFLGFFYASTSQADISQNIPSKIYDQQSEKKITKVAKELQDFLATKMLDQMFEGQKPNKLFGGGSAEKTYQSLLNEERAKSLDLGLVEQIKKQMQPSAISKERKNGFKRKQ